MEYEVNLKAIRPVKMKIKPTEILYFIFVSHTEQYRHYKSIIS